MACDHPASHIFEGYGFLRVGLGTYRLCLSCETVLSARPDFSENEGKRRGSAQANSPPTTIAPTGNVDGEQ